MSSDTLPLVAYCTRSSGQRIAVGTAGRKWMDDTSFGFANRCLPLRIANQAGWFILNEYKVDVVWTGGPNIEDVMIRCYPDDSFAQPPYAVSHFGSGIVTWRIPYLFRTPPGYDLYVRGPTNWCKDGACPLDAIVETDWASATFTMNWKITRSDVSISFDVGEPICMILPMRRGDLEKFQPEVHSISDDAETERKFRLWSDSRTAFNKDLRDNGKTPGWQKHYYVGRTPSGEAFADHRLRLRLKEFGDCRTNRERKSCDAQPTNV